VNQFRGHGVAKPQLPPRRQNNTQRWCLNADNTREERCIPMQAINVAFRNFQRSLAENLPAIEDAHERATSKLGHLCVEEVMPDRPGGRLGIAIAIHRDDTAEPRRRALAHAADLALLCLSLRSLAKASSSASASDRLKLLLTSLDLCGLARNVKGLHSVPQVMRQSERILPGLTSAVVGASPQWPPSVVGDLIISTLKHVTDDEARRNLITLFLDRVAAQSDTKEQERYLDAFRTRFWTECAPLRTYGSIGTLVAAIAPAIMAADPKSRQVALAERLACDPRVAKGSSSDVANPASPD
jgi:hypothetical protein